MFRNRKEAAKLLAGKLGKYKNKKNTFILAIPRGGLEIGNVLAKELNLPLDIILTKKIGYPGNEEVAIGAVSLTSKIISPDFSNISKNYMDLETKRIRELLQRRQKMYREGKPIPSLKRKTIIIVDDGIAMGSTMQAAIILARLEKPQKIIVAVPGALAEGARKVQREADEFVCLIISPHFFAISQFYEDFPQIDDEEAIKLLKEANKNPNRPKGRGIFNVSDTPSDDGELMQNNPTTASSGVSETNEEKRRASKKRASKNHSR